MSQTHEGGRGLRSRPRCARFEAVWGRCANSQSTAMPKCLIDPRRTRRCIAAGPAAAAINMAEVRSRPARDSWVQDLVRSATAAVSPCPLRLGLNLLPVEAAELWVNLWRWLLSVQLRNLCDGQADGRRKAPTITPTRRSSA